MHFSHSIVEERAKQAPKPSLSCLPHWHNLCYPAGMARRLALLLVFLLPFISSAACREDGEGEIEIASLTFEGVEQVDRGALANALQTRKGSRFPWGRKRYFDRRAFEADLERIVAFYRDRGFPDARVIAVEPRLDAAQTKIDVTVRIREGKPIVVEAVDLQGFDVLPERRQRRLARRLPLREGQPLDAQQAAAAREQALNELRNHGYPYADVTISNERIDPYRERVAFHAAAGTLAHFGEVQVNGQTSVNENVILRQLTFNPGDRYSRDVMRESQRKLYRMELFEFVNVEPLADRETKSPEVPVRVTVGESKHRKLNFGFGYGSEDKARVRARIDDVNFFGGARHAGLEGRWSSITRGVRAELNEPYFLHRNFSLSFQGQLWYESEPAFTQNTRGGRVVLRHQSTQATFWSASLINEFQQSTIDETALTDFTARDELIALGLDPDTGQTRGTVSAVAFDFGRNTTNNILDARRGYMLNLHLEQAGRWMWGSYNYWSATLEGRHYLPLGRRFVVANRASLGSLDPAGENQANVPFHKRFFLGGATSNRGWGRFELSPLSAEGFPIGGLSMFDGSSELRFPIAGKFGGVLFLDYANVWPGAWDVDLSDLQYSAGTGLRYQTPIGPARVDFGYQLNQVEGLLVEGEPQKRGWRIHFSIGQAF